MRVLFFLNFTKIHTVSMLEKIVILFSEAKIEMAAMKQQREELKVFEKYFMFIEDLEIKDCDLLLTVGGDGTMIKGAYYSALYGKPIIGVSAGTLNYLTEIKEQTLEQDIRKILEGEYGVSRRCAISAIWDGGNIPFVLNDILITGMASYQLNEFSVFCNGQAVDHYRADAYLFATPTGSTAHLLAYGGPVVNLDMDAVVLRPVGAQTGLQCPLVFPLKYDFAVECDKDTMIICDGKKGIILPAHNQLLVKRSKYETQFVTLGMENSVYRIREKLFYLNNGRKYINERIHFVPI